MINDFSLNQKIQKIQKIQKKTKPLVCILRKWR